MGKRAVRRHNNNRLKRKRASYHCVQHYYDPHGETIKKRIGIAIDTPKLCSCFMCGNPRKYFNEKTIQEKKFDLVNILEYE